MYHWPHIPPPFTPRAMRFWACGPGGAGPGLIQGARRWQTAGKPSSKNSFLGNCCQSQ